MGQARYPADVLIPGTLWGKALRSPVSHARIVHIDASQARRVLGVRAVLTALLGLGPEHWPRRLIMREIDTPTAAFDRLYQAIFQPLIDAFKQVVVIATDRDPDNPETTILTNALLGECLIFHRNRPIILRDLGWHEYTPDRIALVVDIVVEGILDALDLPAVKGEGARAK